MVALTGDPRGVCIGPPSGHSIVCLESTSSFLDPGQANLPNGAEKSDPSMPESPDLEWMNSGILGQLYTSPGDTVVVNVESATTDDVSRELCENAARINAELWEIQTGIRLATADRGEMRFVPHDTTMLDFAASVWRATGSTRFIAGSVNKRLAVLFEDGSERLIRLAESNRLLDYKPSARRMFARCGLGDLEYRNVDGATVGVHEIEPQLAGLPEHKRYIVKAAASAAGRGVYLNDRSGYHASELPQAIAELYCRGGLSGPALVEELVPGASMGAIAWFDGTRRPRLLSIHQHVQDGSRSVGAVWRRSVHERLAERVTRIYERLTTLPVELLGPVEVDFMWNGRSITPIECNPRLTGCSPIGWLLYSLASEDGYGLPREVKKIDLVMDYAPLVRDYKTAESLPVNIGAVLSNPEVQRSCEGRPMILPQGLDPFKSTKVLFVNDSQGCVRSAFETSYRREDGSGLS